MRRYQFGSSLVMFGGTDLPATVGFVPMPILGLVDAVQISGITMPALGRVIGLHLETNGLAAGDSVEARITIGGTQVGGTITVTPGAPGADIIFPPTDDVTLQQAADGFGYFTNGDFLSVEYQTATGGVYTAVDVIGALMLAYDNPDTWQSS